MPEMMGRQERILSQYAAMAGITGQMLAAARAEDWDGLAALETQCSALVSALQQDDALAAMSALTPQQRQQNAALIGQMLADDGEIRSLIAARMTHLSNQMHSASTERKLSRVYGA